MMKRIILLVVAGLMFTSTAYGAEVKVMRGISLVEEGENCKLISEELAWKITPENMKDTYDKATTLKQMVSDGWKIDFVKEMPSKYRIEYLFIFTKL